MGKRKGDESEPVEATAKKSKTSGNITKDEAKLLGFFLQYHMDERKGMTFEVVAAGDLNCHKSNNRWRAVWKALKDQGLIQPAATGKGCEITEKGIQEAETPEYKEFMKDKNYVAATNEEYQERLKNRFKCKKSAAIFDLLLQHGSLTRYELAGIVGEKDRGHSFSYSLQELTKTKGFMEHDPSSSSRPKKFRLSDKAFLKPEDRPEPQELDAEVLAKAVQDNCRPRERKTTKTTQTKSKDKTVVDGTEGCPAKKSKAVKVEEGEESASAKIIETERSNPPGEATEAIGD